jgi:hypothetical protein
MSTMCLIRLTQAPNESRLTFRPVRPRCRYSIRSLLLLLSVFVDMITVTDLKRRNFCSCVSFQRARRHPIVDVGTCSMFFSLVRSFDSFDDETQPIGQADEILKRRTHESLTTRAVDRSIDRKEKGNFCRSFNESNYVVSNNNNNNNNND